MSHKLRMQHWQDGQLITVEHIFEGLERAKEFCSQITKPSSIKIYNEYNEIIHHESIVEEPQNEIESSFEDLTDQHEFYASGSNSIDDTEELYVNGVEDTLFDDE